MQRAFLAFVCAVSASSFAKALAAPEGIWEGPWVPQGHRTPQTPSATGCRIAVSHFESTESGDSMTVDGIVVHSQPANTCADMAVYKEEATAAGRIFYGRAFLEGYSEEGAQRVRVVMDEGCAAPCRTRARSGTAGSGSS